MPRIAFTKGRLLKQTSKLFAAIGYDVDPILNPGRQLILPLNGSVPHEGVLAKAPDVITYVRTGACDIGVVGKDVIMEQGGEFYELLDLGIGVCKLCLATPNGDDFFIGSKKRRVATKYPLITAKYLGNRPAEIINIQGSVELAPLLGLADGIVDIVETGDTLRANGLIPIEDIHRISARVIVNVAAWKLRRREIEPLIAALKTVV